MSHVLVVHPGQMGSAVGRALVAAGHRVSWDPVGRSGASAERAKSAGVVEWDGSERQDVVLSVVPPAHARTTAERYAGIAEYFVDANAISPATAVTVAAAVDAAGGHHVDGSIIGPPPDPSRSRPTRLYLSGPHADRVSSLLDCGPELEIRVLDAPYAASSLKMAYASWTKISSALLLSAREAAERLGVGDELDAEWAHSQPDLAARHDAAAAAASGKAWRWAEEMRQIAATFESCGLPEGFGDAAATVFDDYPNAD